MSNDFPAPVPTPTGDTQSLWRDSSLDLQSGLDVVELHVDIVLPTEPLPLPTALVTERR